MQIQKAAMADGTKTVSGMRVYKLVVLGEGGVGKSALTMQFVSHVFLDFHDPTIEDAYQAQVVVDGEVGLLDILDTAGQEEFTAMREQYMRHGEGFIFVYSLIDRHSFMRLRNHIHTLQRVRFFEKVPVVLVANKLDLEEKRQVSRSDGIALARELDCPFYEASAAGRQNVEEMFLGLVREIRRKGKENLSSDAMRNKKRNPLRRFHKFMSRLMRR